MSMWKQTAKKAGGEQFEIPEAGAQEAVCIALVDLGTHSETFKDKEKNRDRTSTVRKVLIVWELTNQPMSGMKDTNHVIGRDYNLSFTEKSGLRKMIEAWTGKKFKEDEEFDIQKLVGMQGMVNVVHTESERTGRNYARFDGVGPPHKKIPIPPAKHESLVWSIGDDDGLLPDWLPWVWNNAEHQMMPAVQMILRSREMKGDLARTASGTAEDLPTERGPF